MNINGLTLDFLGHDGFVIRSEHVSIAIDPFHVPASLEPVDLILITHGHFDHCSVEDIHTLLGPKTVVVGPADIQSAILKIEGAHLQPIEPGDLLEFGTVKVEAVPAYNLTKFRDAEKKVVFHDKRERFVGYVITHGSTIIYHAGDTDVIPEMHKLTGHGKQGNRFIALLPVSGTYVMTAEEAAEAASLLKPDVAIPMHYGAGVVGTVDDARRFVELCRDSGLHAEILEKK
ncbi:MAG: MBL fold metallo-hydrolase [Nanoarchaeota archaeon]